MQVFHANQGSGKGRGSLLNAYTGELLPGDYFQFEPAGEGLSQYQLSLEVLDNAHQGADNTDLRAAVNGYWVQIFVDQLAMVEAAREGCKWRAPQRHVFTYLSALTPTQQLEFTVSLILDYQPRVEQRFEGLRPEGPTVPSVSSHHGPLFTLEWWMAVRKSELTDQGSPLPGLRGKIKSPPGLN